MLGVCLVRVPQEHAALRATLRLNVAAVLGELAWRRACQRCPAGGSYARWRHLLVPLYAALDIRMSRFGIVRAGLDTTSPPPAGLGGALHHLLLLVLSSRFTTNLVAWCLAHRLM